jgi:outer membrane receptor protein involved in Fe transport
VLEKEISMAHSNSPLFRTLILSLFFLGFFVSSFPSFGQDQTAEKKKKEKEQEQAAKITEEILVIGEAPKEMPVSTVSKIDYQTLQEQKPLDLSEALKFVPSAYVTVGEKDEFTLKLRGLDSRRVALFIDGVPSYEPYFSNFDLKTVEVESANSIQVTRGPSSVLYGPNTLGGIVNVITRRPAPEPALNLEASYAENKTYSLGLHSSASWKKFSLIGHALFQDSAGYYYSDGNNRISRGNSDYDRLSLNAKLYYTPSNRTEILFNGNYYHSAYGIPISLVSARPRYWRFKNWDRYSLNAGGFTSIGQKSLLRFRAYWIQYENSLDAFDDPEMTRRQYESTYDNSVFGFFALGDLPTSPENTVKLSLTLQQEISRQQDDLGLPWLRYNQGIYSVAGEDHFVLSPAWTMIAGLSLDYLNKFNGGSSQKLNPLVGLKFSPWENLELHLSLSRKSRFPSMRSLYSESSGNPDLHSEAGTLGELGFSWSRGIFLSAAVFFSDFKDMIESVRLPDGLRRFYNIGRAYINGLEIQLQKSAGPLAATLNYTYLDHKNRSEDRPLDALPNHTLSFDLGLSFLRQLHWEIFGLYASSSSWFDTTTMISLRIPAYFYSNTVLSYGFGRAEIFVKLTNMFNKAYFTEPGFPCQGRTLEMGFRADIFGKY